MPPFRSPDLKVRSSQIEPFDILAQRDFTIRSVTAATDTATVSDCYISLDTSSNDVALTLPETDNLMLIIRHDDTSTGTNTATITNTCNGESGPWTLPKGPWICLIYDGTEWTQAFSL